jgi:hypothetical protein
MQVSVDDKFARFGSKGYAINKINSVEVRQWNPHSKVGALLCGLIAFMCLLSAIGGGGSSALGLFVIFSGLAYWTWRRSQIVEYQLFLMTSSSEAQAFVTRDRDQVNSLRDRIETAIAAS